MTSKLCYVLSDRCPGLTGTVEDQVPGGFSSRPGRDFAQKPRFWGFPGVGWGGSQKTSQKCYFRRFFVLILVYAILETPKIAKNLSLI